MFSVSHRESMKTGRAPKRAKALAIDTNVKDGTLTSSPGFSERSSADISNACVQDEVSRSRPAVVVSPIDASTHWVNLPFPELCSLSMVSARRLRSSTVISGRLKGIFVLARVLVAGSFCDGVRRPVHDAKVHAPDVLSNDSKYQ